MVRLIPLGGLGEIGVNMMALECDDCILVIDAGLMFPDDYMPGVDFLIPDFGYLKEKRDRIHSIVLTHGHEDHIGAVPFFLREFSVPVFATSFTLELLKVKLAEHHLLEQADLREIREGQTIPFGPFKVNFIAVNHSIVAGLGLAIKTPEGLILHSGDFKIDLTPIQVRPTDLNRFAHYGEKGVLALLSDSTNAEKEGFTLSEREVGRRLEDVFQACEGRIIVAVFASNISRIQEVVNLAVSLGRKVLFNGKSMVTNINIAKQQGYITVPGGSEISEGQIKRFPDKDLTVITTGSQGEPMSALTRMAQGSHKSIKIKEGDTVILSSRFIPGNEKAINNTINNLYRMGAKVIYEKVQEIHTSGHAKREELKLMLSLVNPLYFIPIHGELRHLVNHVQLALDMGIPKDRALLIEDGAIVCFGDGKAWIEGRVPTGRILVDGKGVGDVEEVVLKDRRRLSEHGMVMVLLAVDQQTGERIYGPDLISRGFVLENQGDPILESANDIILEILEENQGPGPYEWKEVESIIQRRLKRYFNNAIQRRPLVLPIIIPL